MVDLMEESMSAHSGKSSGKAARKPERSAIMESGSSGPGSPGRVPASRNTSFLCLAIASESTSSPASLLLFRCIRSERDSRSVVDQPEKLVNLPLPTIINETADEENKTEHKKRSVA